MYYLSIITVTFNDKEGLLRTMDSILPLPSNCEWIIIDADSKDGTKTILNNLPKQKNIIWISESDNGLYEGMNKGISLSSGRYLNFMNAGDMYVREDFNNIIEKQLDNYDIFVFNYIALNNKLELSYSRSFQTDINCIKDYDCIPHQSTIISKNIFTNIGYYDLQFKYAADYDFFAKAYFNGYKFYFNSDIKLAYFIQDGLSSNLKNSLKIALECKKIQCKHFSVYSKKLFLTYIAKYLIAFFPFSKEIFITLRMLFLNKSE